MEGWDNKLGRGKGAPAALITAAPSRKAMRGKAYTTTRPMSAAVRGRRPAGTATRTPARPSMATRKRRASQKRRCSGQCAAWHSLEQYQGPKQAQNFVLPPLSVPRHTTQSSDLGIATSSLSQEARRQAWQSSVVDVAGSHFLLVCWLVLDWCRVCVFIPLLLDHPCGQVLKPSYMVFFVTDLCVNENPAHSIPWDFPHCSAFQKSKRLTTSLSQHSSRGLR